MAAPSYTTDLLVITLAENAGTWAEFTGMAVGGSPDITDVDNPIQGTYHTSATVKSGLNSIAFTGSGYTVPTGGAILIWYNFYSPGLLDLYANGGIRAIAGSALGAYKAWSVGGKDVSPNPYGGWQNIAVDPTLTADYTYGSPTTALTYIGIGINLTAAVSKGQPNTVDAMRYGRCEARLNGGDLANGYATFSGFAAVNDTQTNRWGLLQEVAGGYLWKGLLTLGYSSVVDFRDSNKMILVQDSRKVGSGFNKIEIRQATSRVDWTSISIQALGTVSKGALEVIDNADVNFDGCTFTDMDTFIFLSGSYIVGTTFRRCGQVTQNGAVFDECLITRSTAAVAMLVSDLAQISDSEFISVGTGHALQLTAAHAGNSYTLSNVVFTGYASADGTSGNEAIYNNSGGAVTITLSGGSTPSIRNGTLASTTIVSGAVSASVTAQKADGTKIQDANILLAASAGGAYPSLVTVTIVNSGTTATVTHTAHNLATNDKVLISGASLAANNGVFSITKTGENTYTYTMTSSPGSSPTGTIKSTYVLLKGLSNALGVLSMSRVFSGDQPVYGWARKSSGSPYYKEGVLSGTVLSASGASFTAILAPDE